MENLIKWIKKEIDAKFNPDWGDLPCLMRPADGYYGKTEEYELDYSKEWLREPLMTYNEQVAEIASEDREPLSLYITVEEKYDNYGGGYKSIEVYLFSQDIDAIEIKSAMIKF